MNGLDSSTLSIVYACCLARGVARVLKSYRVPLVLDLLVALNSPVFLEPSAPSIQRSQPASLNF
ncbi:hypothetical protein DSO57_1005221 [Entomophthora muscae]|uniref:Uncharacterized protein n=1 Tax=Entomophthora muscae TaxID=34485 RepID=A0ACC2T816_9FUNG|nr:hypothetical protein DSO57_1005221 [Entomophthora muscae]